MLACVLTAFFRNFLVHLLRVLWQLKLRAGISHTNIELVIGLEMLPCWVQVEGDGAGSLQEMTIWPVSKNTGL